ncbi:MAG: hypothetical protein QOE06_1168 [Thermoleophilaceae bacterium]|nr:hypothetical protein [Thermoleophilaceae bacterium]
MRLPLISLLAVLAVAGTAQAAVTPFGSDLSAPANRVNSHATDTAFWNATLAGGQGVTAPEDGQITTIRVKGGVLTSTKDNQLARLVHFQVLRPLGGTRNRVQLTSGNFYLPRSDDPQVVTTYSAPKLVNLCVNKGDIVDLNTIGGFEFRPNDSAAGSQLQVFSDVPGSLTRWYEKAGGTNNGATLPSFSELPGQELLMQTWVASGPDATEICPGGYRGHAFRGLDVVAAPQPALKAKQRRARLKGHCPGQNFGGCYGKLRLTAVIDGAEVSLGSVGFSIRSGYKNTIEVPISQKNVTAIQKANGVTATVTSDAHDNPRIDKRAKWSSVPVQRKTTTRKVRLNPK